MCVRVARACACGESETKITLSRSSCQSEFAISDSLKGRPSEASRCARTRRHGARSSCSWSPEEKVRPASQSSTYLAWQALIEARSTVRRPREIRPGSARKKTSESSTACARRSTWPVQFSHSHMRRFPF